VTGVEGHGNHVCGVRTNPSRFATTTRTHWVPSFRGVAAIDPG
jgi:hypothetical protein